MKYCFLLFTRTLLKNCFNHILLNNHSFSTNRILKIYTCISMKNASIFFLCRVCIIIRKIVFIYLYGEIGVLKLFTWKNNEFISRTESDFSVNVIAECFSISTFYFVARVFFISEVFTSVLFHVSAFSRQCFFTSVLFLVSSFTLVVNYDTISLKDFVWF